MGLRARNGASGQRLGAGIRIDWDGDWDGARHRAERVLSPCSIVITPPSQMPGRRHAPRARDRPQPGDRSRLRQIRPLTPSIPEELTR